MQNPQIHETDLTVEHDLGWNTVISATYLGSYGRELPDFVDQNIAPSTQNITYTVVGGGPIATPTLTEPLYTVRPNPNFGQMVDIFSGVNSNYQALALQLNHRLSHSLQFGANYTWAHAIDYGQNENTTGVTAQPVDPFNLHLDKGNSAYDVPNRFVLHMVADSPWHKSGWLGYIANGFEARTCFPNPEWLAVFVGNQRNSAGLYFRGWRNQRLQRWLQNSSDRPSHLSNVRATQVVDLRLSKHFVWSDRYDLELLGEGFNLLNHQNVTSVNTTGYSIGGATPASATLTYQTNFGVVNNANSVIAYTQRQVQLGIRLHF